jgi:hypothetical protein
MYVFCGITFILETFLEVNGAGGIAEESTHSKDKGKKRKASEKSNVNVALKDFTIQYAKSNRSTCRGCEEKIMKVSVCMRTCWERPIQ